MQARLLRKRWRRAGRRAECAGGHAGEFAFAASSGFISHIPALEAKVDFGNGKFTVRQL
jgi:hypothetical protein